MKGELVDFAELGDRTACAASTHVFGLGNVLTGKGNIKESRKNAQEIGTRVVQSYLGLRGDAPLAALARQMHTDAREQAEPAVAAGARRSR